MRHHRDRKLIRVLCVIDDNGRAMHLKAAFPGTLFEYVECSSVQLEQKLEAKEIDFSAVVLDVAYYQDPDLSRRAAEQGIHPGCLLAHETHKHHPNMPIVLVCLEKTGCENTWPGGKAPDHIKEISILNSVTRVVTTLRGMFKNQHTHS
jgi:hypothetical protein